MAVPHIAFSLVAVAFIYLNSFLHEHQVSVCCIEYRLTRRSWQCGGEFVSRFLVYLHSSHLSKGTISGF